MMAGNKTRIAEFSFVSSACLVLAACGGGGGASSPPTEEATGILRIAITDALVDDVTVVNVQFAGVTLKPASGGEIEIEFAPKDIDLLTLSNGMTAELLPDTAVPAGRYNWIRLAVNAEFDNVFDSYAMTSTGLVELQVPSGSNAGLRLVSGFTVTQNQSTDLVIDWDLRMALADPIGRPGLHLRPALRVTDMASYGTLHGTVDEPLVTDEECTNDLAAQTGNAVYVYKGMTDTPGDIADVTNEPFVTAAVTQNGASGYSYEVNFLPIGDYTAAFTCQANNDVADSDDDIVFSAPQPFAIEDGVTTTVNF
jgi:hypothetical protein